jgi:hypothetical protein
VATASAGTPTGSSAVLMVPHCHAAETVTG